MLLTFIKLLPEMSDHVMQIRGEGLKLPSPQEGSRQNSAVTALFGSSSSLLCLMCCGCIRCTDRMKTTEDTNVVKERTSTNLKEVTLVWVCFLKNKPKNLA